MTRAAVLCVGLALLASACAQKPTVEANAPTSQESQAAPSATVGPGGHHKIGQPYQVAGVWYHPKPEPSYDEVGVASWYGPKFHGRTTANGETYDQYAMTAAHPTLPMPTLVEVTNLANGKTVILRINDRGPFAKGRIIDVSKAAAQKLGFIKKGVTQVRVRIVEEERPQVAGQGGSNQVAGGPLPDAAPVEGVAETQLPAQSGQSGSLRPATQIAAAPSTANGQQVFLQAGAFRDYNNALRQARSLSGVGEPLIEAIGSGDEVFYRVRIGPMQDRGLAEKLRIALQDQGIAESHIIVE